MKKKKKKLQGGGPTQPAVLPDPPGTALPLAPAFPYDFRLNNLIPSYDSNFIGPFVGETLNGFYTGYQNHSDNLLRASMQQQGNWMSSPMYKQMLYNSLKDTFSEDQITAFQNARLQNLSTMPTSVKFYEPEERPGTGGVSINRTGQVMQAKRYEYPQPGDPGFASDDLEIGEQPDPNEVLPISYMQDSLYPHEVSHSIDRPVRNRRQRNFLNLDKYQRLIPDADLELMQNSLLSSPGYNPIKFWEKYGDTPEEGSLKYFTRPTEVRARLNEIRMMGLNKGIYDPRTQLIDEEAYDKLRHSAKGDLETYFTKDGIINMLNSISDATPVNTNKNIGMAATGGQVKKMQAGGPAPKDKDKQPVDLSLVESPPPSMSPVGGPFDMEAYNQLRGKLNPDIRQNIDYLNNMGDFSGIEPDEDNIPKDFAPENYNFGQLPSASSMSTIGESRSTTIGQEMAYDLARKGIVRNKNGEMVNMKDGEGAEFDRATWWDKLWGDDADGFLYKRTIDYAPVFKTEDKEKRRQGLIKQFGLSDDVTYEEAVQRDAYEARSMVPFQMFDKMFQGYESAGYYPVWDEDTEQYVLQETALTEEEFRRVRGALINPYGPAPMAKTALGAFVDNFSHTLGALGPDLLNFAELVTDLGEATYNKIAGTGDWDSDPNGWTDRVAASARVSTEFHNYAKSAMEQTDNMFSNGTALMGGLGSGIASLLSFWGMGGAAAKVTTKGGLFLAKQLGKKFPRKMASFMGHIAGGTPINAGEIYKKAKLDGLDDDEAAIMGLAVGFVNSLIEYGVGTNALANRAMGIRGQSAIYNAIFDYAKKTGMKVNSKSFLDKATGPILKSVFQRLERMGVDGPKTLGYIGRGLSSGIEEGTEEAIQGSIIQATQLTYNNYFAADDAEYGSGKFRMPDRFDGSQLMQEAGLGFILGAGARTIMSGAYEPDLMTLIAEGRYTDVDQMIDHLYSKEALSLYQRNKLKRRVEGLNALWTQNEIAYSYLSPKGQYIVGQSLLHDENYKNRLNRIEKRRADINSNDKLTDNEKQKRLDKLKAEELGITNLKNINDTLLEYFADPNLAKQYNLENIPPTIIQGLKQLALQKTRSEYQKQKIEELFNSLQPNKKRKFRQLIKSLDKDPRFKDIVESLKVTQAAQEGKEQEAYDALIQRLDENIKQHDDKINELLTSPDTWAGLDQAVSESMKTDEEQQEEQEGPKSERTKQDENIPKETRDEKRKRKAKEAAVKAQQQADRQAKAVEEVIGGTVEAVAPTHIVHGNEQISEVLRMEIGPDGKKQYVLTDLDKNGKNIIVKEKDVKGERFGITTSNKHMDNFQTTYWLHVVSEAGSMGTMTKEELQDRILTDPDLINNIQIEFVSVPRELGNNPIEQGDMQINMNGSFLQIRDMKTKKLIGVVRSSNRFYDKEGNLIPGDKMTKEFFYKNFQKTGQPFTDQSWAEFQNNYKILNDTLTKLETLYPGASLENPQVLDDSLFSFNFEGGYANNRNEDRISIDNITSPHTFDGDYIIYDKHLGKVVLGANPSQEHMSKLPGEEFEGRYFALVKRGNITKWVRIFPKRVDEKAANKRLQTLKKDIARLNQQIKTGVELDYNQELDAINKKLNMFIAIDGIDIKVGADFDKKTNSYKLSIYGQRKIKDQYQKIKGLNNVRLANNASLKTVIDTINGALANIQGGAQITNASFKESIPDDGSEVNPADFESSLLPGAGFMNPTMSIEVSNDIYTLQEPTFTEEVIEEEISLEDKDSYTAEELEQQLRKELGDEMANLDVKNLNNGVRLDLESQLFAQLKDGDVFTEDVTDALNQILDKYIEGITIKSFVDPNKTYTKEEYKQVVEQAKFALRQKVILQSPEFDRSSLFDKIKAQYKYMAEEADILSENWDMDFTELGGIESLPSRIKQFISNLTTPTTDIFGRTTWQSEKYGTTQILKTLDGHTIAGKLMMMLSNQTNEGNIMARLDAVAAYDPQMAQVRLALKNNPSFIPGFVNAFNRFELGYVKMLVEDNKANIVDSISNGAAAQILRKWYSRSAGIDTKTKNAAIKEIKSILEKDGTPYSNVELLVKAFDKLGWDITPAAAAYMLGDQALRDAYPELMYNELGNFKGFLGKLSNYNKKPNSLKQNHPLYKMAQIAAIFDPSTYEANYRDAEGKSRYKYVPRNLYMEVARLSKEGKLNDRFTLLPNNLLKDNVSGIEIKMAGDFVQGQDTATNKTISDKQRVILMFGLFLNEDIQGHAYYTPHVIESKKSLYAIRLPKKKYYDGGVTQLAIDDMYNSLFVREFERNLTDEGKLDGGQYFGILSMLENMKITGINGEQQTVPEFLKGRETLDGIESFIKDNIIKPALQTTIADLNNRITQLNLRDDINKLVLDGPSVGDYNFKVGNMALNYLIMGGNYTQLALGDSNFKNDVDFNKRLAGFNAAGLKKGTINYKYIMIDDNVIDTDFGAQSVTNDAQVIITLPMYAVRELEAQNYTSDKQKKVLEKLRDSLDDPSIVVTNAEINSLDLNSTKTVYEDGNRYFKKSDFILTKQVAEQQAAAGNPQLLNIYNALNNNKVMYLIAQSASKRKSDPGVSDDFFKTSQDINEDLIFEGSMQYERDQVLNKTKARYGLESESAVAKQLHDLIGSVVQGDNRQIVDVINQSNADNKAIFNELINTIVSDPNNKELAKAIILENNRGRRNDTILDLFENYNYNIPHVRNLVKNAILNLFNRDALTSRAVGGQATLISGTHFVNPQTGEPLRIHRNVDGTIEYAEILASRKMFNLNEFGNIKDVPSKLLTAFGVRIPVQAHHSMIPLKVVGFLPDAQGDSIVTPLELPALAGSDYDLDKLYLHRYASILNEEGQRVVLPAEPTLAQYKQYWSENQYVKLAQQVFNLGLTETMQRLGLLNDEGQAAYSHPQALQNNMLDNMFAIFNTPEVQEVMFQPATEGKARDFVEKYGGKETKKSIFTVTGILDYHVQNKIGAGNVGIGANANSAYSIITQFAEQMQIPVNAITIDGKEYNTYTVVKEDDINDKLELEEGTRSKFDSMSSIITLFVDNVKLGLAPQVNLSADMTIAAMDLIALGIGQMRTLMIVNQPILKYYTEQQELVTPPEDYKGNYHLEELKTQLKGIKATELNSKKLDKYLKSDLVFADVFDKYRRQWGDNKFSTEVLSKEELEYLQTQKAVLEVVGNILTGLAAKRVNKLTQVLSTVSGLDQQFATNNKRRGFLMKSLNDNKALRQVHPVYENSKNVLDNLNNIYDKGFLNDVEVQKVFVSVYGNTTKADAARIIQRIQELKKNPKYKKNIALHALLKVVDGQLIADSQTKMSPEIEGLLIGNFEDLFEDNKGLADDLLRYLFGTSKLDFVNNSFVKYLPAKTFEKFSKALDQAQETGVIPKEKPVFIEGPVELEQIEEVTEDFAAGEYTPTQIAKELNIKKFTPLINNLEKAGVKVIYDPQAKGNSYMQGKIKLNNLSTSLFLEEALHAGLDTLPKEEKRKLRQDVLKWYKELVKNHGNDENAKGIQDIFNRYKKFYDGSEERAAEEIITHLVYKDEALVNDLNKLRSPNEQGILFSMWSKFVQLLADVFGIDIQEGSELAELSRLLTPVDRLLNKDYEYASFSEDQMFNLPAGNSSMFSDIAVKTTASNVSKLLTNQEFSQMVFDGEAMPILESIVRMFEGNKDRGLASIQGKVAIGAFADLRKSQQEDLAKELGYKNLEDWKKNGTKLEKDYIKGLRGEAMVLKLKPYMPETTEDLVKMRSVDPDRNVTNNVLILLNKQLQEIQKGNVKNTAFVKNRSARLAKIIADIELAQDVFNSIDDFYDDVKAQHTLLNAFLGKNRSVEEMIDGLTKYRILLEDMSFINELPEAFKSKLKTAKYKDSEKMLKKLQESVTLLEDMKTTLRKEFIPVLANKLYPMIKKSGVETKKFVDIRLDDVNKQIDKILASDLDDPIKADKIRRLKGMVAKFSKLAEQAPQSEADFANFLLYSTHDMDWLGYMLMAPGVTSDPGLAGLVNYTASLAIEARRQAINISNELESTENLLKQGIEEQGGKLSDNPRILYEQIIEKVNHRGTNNKDVWTLVTKYDNAAFEKALEEAELKIAGNSELMKKLRVEYFANIDRTIKKLKAQIEGYKLQENQEAVAEVISDLETRLQRLETQKKIGPEEKDLLRLQLRKTGWYKNNMKPKTEDEIRTIMRRQNDVRGWARSQMNPAAMYKLGIIDKAEFDMMQSVESAVSGMKNTTPVYFGYQVTQPNDRFINKKWSNLYDKTDKPKNKIGEAHAKFTEIYRDSLAKVYKKQTVDMALPSLRKGFYDRILDKKGVQGLKEEFARMFRIDEDDAFVYGYAAMQNQTRNYAPVYFMEEIDASEVSLDVKGSLMTFANAALRTEQNNEVLKLAYMLRDTYNQNRIVDPTKPDVIGINKLGRKIASVKQGESYVAKRLEKYIEMVLLGKTKNVTYLPGTNLQIDKIIDNVLSYTAITTLGLDFLKGSRNWLTAVWQQGIEAGAGRANKGKVSLQEFLDGHKIMADKFRDLTSDKYKKLGNKSYLGQLLLYFDAIQGGFDDFASGKQTTGNTLLRQTLLNPDNLLINYHIGEVSAQGAAAIALLKKRKVTVNGEKVGLYDAFRVNKKTGNFEFKGTEAERKAAQEMIRTTTLEIAEMNRRLNGNYKSIDKTVLSQSAGGRMLELFRKFLIPTVMNRWRVDFVNHEKGEPDGGFYRRTIANMWNAWKTSAETDLIKRALDTKRRSTLTPQDKEALMRVMHEATLLAILSALVSTLMSMQDDDDEEISVPSYYLLYLLTTTRAEIMAFAPTPQAAGEFLRILRSPTAMTTSIERTMKLLKQLGAPMEEYQRDSGPWEKGENKLKVRALQWLGISGLQTDPETALRNFLMITER